MNALFSALRLVLTTQPPPPFHFLLHLLETKVFGIVAMYTEWVNCIEPKIETIWKGFTLCKIAMCKVRLIKYAVLYGVVGYLWTLLGKQTVSLYWQEVCFVLNCRDKWSMLVRHLCLIMVNQWVWKQATTDWLTENSYLFVLVNDECPSAIQSDKRGMF